MGKRMTKYEKASVIGMIGGLLMLVAGVTGAAAWNDLGLTVAIHISNSEAIMLIFKILAILGALGGLLVIAGALVLKKRDNAGRGRLLITIGAGFGLIGLIIFILVSILGGDILFFTGLGLGIAGLILSIMARQMSKV